MGKKDILFLIVLFLALVTGFVVSLSYPYRARFFPLSVISLCGVLVLVELLKAFIAGRQSGAADGNHPANEETPETSNEELFKLISVIAWIGAFALSIKLFGFVIGLPLFLLAYIKMQGERWLWAIILPAAMFVIVYVGFGLLLKRPLYEGLLFLG